MLKKKTEFPLCVVFNLLALIKYCRHIAVYNAMSCKQIHSLSDIEYHEHLQDVDEEKKRYQAQFSLHVPHIHFN